MLYPRLESSLILRGEDVDPRGSFMKDGRTTLKSDKGRNLLQLLGSGSEASEVRYQAVKQPSQEMGVTS